MNLNLLSCGAQRLDKRALAKCIAEISSNINESLSHELTEILLEVDAVDIQLEDKNAGSSLKAKTVARKHLIKSTKITRNYLH
jgi:hypothetical protein